MSYGVHDGGSPLRARVAADGSLHIDVPGFEPPRRSLTHDAAPVSATAPASMVTREARPDDPRSGMLPDEAGFQTLDFRRGQDGRWTGHDRTGRRFRLMLSSDNSTYRVSPEEPDDLPLGARRQRQGDEALTNPARPLSDEQHRLGLASWQGILDSFWRRKEA
jgi:hypothetical protein